MIDNLSKQGCERIMSEIDTILSEPFFPEPDWELIYTLNLPFPPTTGNHRLGINKKRMYLKPSVKKYYNDIAMLTSSLRKGRILDGKLGAFIYWSFPDKCKRDVDNLTKIVFDALQYAQIVKDDYMLSHRTASVFALTPHDKKACAFVLIFKKRK